MRNYQCRKCSVLVQKDSTPSTLGCPSGGSHNWDNLGQVGSNNYQCRKCSTLVKSNSTPSTLGCPSSGSHNWTKL